MDDQDLPGGAVTERRAKECIRRFIGAYDQIPPMYSALKVGGKKLYELARGGKTVERKSRRVTVYDIRIKDISLPRIRMEVDCSKGTYIRTLCHDIGEKLGCGGCMEQLLRTRVGRFSLAGSRKLDEVEELAGAGKLEDILIPIDRIFEKLGEIRLKEQYNLLAYNGNPFGNGHIAYRKPDQENISGNGKNVSKNEGFRVYDSRGNFIGIYYYDGETERFRCEKMFLDPDQIH